MESTSCGENCPFVKQGFCSTCKECPNYIETWWIKNDESQPTLLKDCSPKRMILQQQEMQSRFELVAQSLVEARNEYGKLCNYLHNLIEMAKSVALKDQKNQIQEIENEKNKLISDSSCTN